MPLNSDPSSFIAKYGVKTISYAIGIGFALLLILIGLGSVATTVSNTDVGIVVNNITKQVTTFENGGMVLHLPFGISTVYHLDKSQRNLRMTRANNTTEHPNGEQIKIKTNDGSNVEADVEVVYQIDVANAFLAYRELMESAAAQGAGSSGSRRSSSNARDSDSNMEAILRAVVRSEVRDQLGNLSTLEISEPLSRNKKLEIVQQNLARYFKLMGVEIVSVNAQNFHFNEEYERIVRERKSADQILVNQADFQSSKAETGKRLVAEATKSQKTQMAQADGELKKRVLTAEGEAKRIITKADQEAYQLDREAQIAVATATQEAAAIEAEGKQKAQALETLFEAYEKGGEGLVREALIKLYEGVKVSAKPYAPSDRVDRIQAVPINFDNPNAPTIAPVIPPVRTGTPVNKGGSSGR